jgi:hypothetical protein
MAQPQGLGVIGNRLVEASQAGRGEAAIDVGVDHFRVQQQRLVVIGEGLLELRFLPIRVAAVVIGPGVGGGGFDRLVEQRDGLLGLSLVQELHAPLATRVGLGGRRPAGQQSGEQDRPQPAAREPR